MDNVEEKIYKQILEIPVPERTQAQNNFVFNHENKKYQVPSKEDLEKAVFILNHKGTDITSLKKAGDWQWAEKILRNNRVARELGMKEGASMSYKPIQVKRTPEDVQKNFKFNWADAYNQLNEKKLKPTEKDAEKLDSFVKEHLDNFDDNSAMKLATDLKLWNPAREKFHEFLKTENGQQFQNYLEDVRKYKQDKEIDRIWKDDSNMLVDFMLPTSKEYAKRNYEKINGAAPWNSVAGYLNGVADMAKPLGFDALSNLFMMTGGGANRYITGLEKGIRNPYLGAVASPIIHGAGDYLNDNKDAKGAALETAVGTGINLMMPFYGQRAYNKLDKILPESLVTNKHIIQNKVDDAVNKYKDYIEAVNSKAIVPRLKKTEIGATEPEVSDFVQKIPKDKFLSKIPYFKKFSQNNNKEIHYTTDVDKTKADLDKLEPLFKKFNPNRPDIEVKSITDIPSSLSVADIPNKYAKLFANDVEYANNRNIFSKIFNNNNKNLINERNSIIKSIETSKAKEKLKKNNPEYRNLEQEIEQKYSPLIREARKNGDETLSSQLRLNQFRELNNLSDRFGMKSKDVRQKLEQEILEKAKISTGKHGDVRDVDLTDLVLAGYNVPNESKLNKVVRAINKNKVLKSYLENMQGRDIYASPFFGIINTLTGGWADINKAKEKKKSLVELYGLDKD